MAAGLKYSKWFRGTRRNEMNVQDENTVERKDDLSTPRHRQLIGVIGLLLPVLLWLISGLRPTGAHPWAVLDSISAYYYTGAVSIFTGMLVVLGLFLYTYLGYDNPYYLRDRWAGCIAGTASILIAIFPTAATGQTVAPVWWTPKTGAIHLTSAAILFLSFFFFAWFQFPISSRAKEDLPRSKKVRNAIYRACGAAILVSIAWVAYAGTHGMSIFWPETLALEFFAISWLLKGRADKSAVEAARKTAYYARHPQEMVKKVTGPGRGRTGLRQPQ
jgi:hypothetical protein